MPPEEQVRDLEAQPDDLHQADPVDDINLLVHDSDIAASGGDETDSDDEGPDQQPQESSSRSRPPEGPSLGTILHR
jgi:hypothetical protein